MSKTGKILIGVGIFLFACLVVWVIRTTPNAPPPEEKIEPPRYMEYRNNTLTEEKDGVKIWELNSERAIIDAMTQNAEFENVKGKFFQEDGKILEITAERGNYEQKTKNVHVEGNVVVIDGDGAKLTGGKLDWIDKDGILIANDDVKISKDDMRAYADRAESKDQFKHFTLKGKARVLKGVKEDDSEKSEEKDK